MKRKPTHLLWKFKQKNYVFFNDAVFPTSNWSGGYKV